jgi:phage gp36-like protein
MYVDQLDKLLETFFYQFCNIAKWIFAFRMASDIIKRGNESDFQGALKSVANGCIGYGCLYSIVYFLNMIQGAIQSSFK